MKGEPAGQEKNPPGTASTEVAQNPVGVSADILVGARHGLHMEPCPCLLADSYTCRPAEIACAWPGAWSWPSFGPCGKSGIGLRAMVFSRISNRHS